MFFWSDSTITLHWIRTSSHKLKTFVANRVSQIQEDTRVGVWRHVPSEDNPADALSRGQSPLEFISNYFWLNGPTWLSNDEQAWPPNLLPDIEVPEQRSTVIMSAVVDRDILERFSSFIKMKRVLAYCMRFVKCCLSRKSNSEDLSPEEIQNSERCILKLIQRSGFERELRQLSSNRTLEIKSNILSLSPFLDADGILRVGGRLKHADLEFK